MYVITTYLFIQIITYFVKCFNEKTAVFQQNRLFHQIRLCIPSI